MEVDVSNNTKTNYICNYNTDNSVFIDKKEIIDSKKTYLFFKRLQDIILSSLALIILSPIMLIVAIVIYIDDPNGSPIFSQIRCGINGKEFKLYKFRSMCVNAEDMLDDLLDDNEMEGPAFKMKEDPRITKIGKFMRMTSIDELPQLWNVLKGDMSLVGPRPPLPREVEMYNEYQMQRLYATPGITCLWQIQPNRNTLSFDEWMDLDIQYIKNRSFFYDLKIIFKTVFAVLHFDGI